MITAGIDAGSRAIKIVLLDAEARTLRAAAEADTGLHQAQAVTALLEGLLAEQGLTAADLSAVVATGYGRKRIAQADVAITEITCHARGVHHLCPDARSVVEIGGQDSKLLRLDDDGRVQDFDMNDRCAAGTGRFLEMVAQRFEVGLAELGPMAAEATAPAAISSMCVVFAETEIIGLLAAGESPANIVAGVQAAIAGRVAGMAGRQLAGPVVFTGGVARVSGMQTALAEALGCAVQIPPRPELTGALGAALLAADRAA